MHVLRAGWELALEMPLTLLSVRHRWRTAALPTIRVWTRGAASQYYMKAQHNSINLIIVKITHHSCR